MRVVVVTGANRGIGFSISSLLLKSAPDISVVLACRDTSKGEDARKKLQAEDDTFVSRTDVLEMDVSTETSVQRAAGLVKDKHGSIFAIVNNAGIGLDLAWDSVKVKRGDAQKTLECNLFGVEYCQRHFSPLLQPNGAVVMVSSGAAGLNMFRMSEEKRAWMLREDLTWPDLKQAAEEFIASFDQHAEVDEMPRLAENGWWLQAYGFSKACLNAYTRVLARERGDEIRVNTCTPGFCLTDMTRGYQKPDTLKTADEGANTPVWLVLDPDTGSGKFWGNDKAVMPWVTEPK